MTFSLFQTPKQTQQSLGPGAENTTSPLAHAGPDAEQLHGVPVSPDPSPGPFGQEGSFKHVTYLIWYSLSQFHGLLKAEEYIYCLEQMATRILPQKLLETWLPWRGPLTLATEMRSWPT